MKLVIAEKPSVAMSLAAVLGANEKKDGYLEGGGYLVSWCIGHLLELAQPEAYGEQYARWRYADLPILPETWKYEVPKDKKKQLALLCRLMKDKGVDSVVCATDAGREGELIFRLVYEHAGCKKPMERLWISSMEDAAIRDGFEHLRPGSDYDTLYDVAVCRAGADWLVGINATRLFSVLYGVTLNVGRVMSPTLALLVQREADIGAFVSRPFYVPEITCGGFTASGEKLAEKAEADTIRIECDKQATSVQSVEKQVKTVQTPHLYDLTTLQRECNRIYGYTAQQTLDYVQSLYEKKLATYPRTDSQYLSEDMQATAASLVLWLRGNMPFGKGCAGEPDIDRVTDGSKVTDHHAIIPTVEIARTDLSELPSGERDVLTLIAARLLSATAQTHRFEAVTAVLDCQGYLFTAKGKTVLQAGWKEVERLYRMGLKESGPEDGGDTDASLPMLQEGQIFETVSAGVREGKTSPPKHYTEDSLLAAMETAGAEDMPEDAERKGLGTPATRAATLEKLVSTGFVQRKKKQLIPTEKGTNLIAVLPDNIKSPILTAEWESRLKQVERGELSAESFMEGIADMSRALVKEHTAPEERFASLFPDPLVEIRSAVHSNYAGMVAMLGADNRVYLGKEERYHSDGELPGYYDNQDGSLCFVCDQPDMYYFLYGEGWAHTQAEMLERGLTLRQYEDFARLREGVLSQFTPRREILFAGQPFKPQESYLYNAELYEEGQTGNYNMLDGRLNNEPPERPDLTDGQTYEEIRELAPETLPEEKPSLMERLKADRPEHEARQAAPPLPERER